MAIGSVRPNLAAGVLKEFKSPVHSRHPPAPRSVEVELGKRRPIAYDFRKSEFRIYGVSHADDQFGSA